MNVHVRQVVEQGLEVPEISSQYREVHGTVKQILDVPVPEMVEQLVEVPETVSRDGVQQRTVEQIVDAPAMQAVEELAEVSKVFSQDRIQQRIVEQIIPATSLAEMIIDAPVIQTPEKTQQAMNTHVHVTRNASEFLHTIACREYTLPRDDKASQPKGWIRGNMRIGPVLEVTTSFQYFQVRN